MTFTIFNFTIKKIFKSYYCWLLMLISVLTFFLINFFILKLFIFEGDWNFGAVHRFIRPFYIIALFLVLGIVISNLTNFVIDKKNLIFILSKNYKRINCLCAKIFALFIFLLVFIGLLTISTFILNIYGTKLRRSLFNEAQIMKHKINVNKIWSDEEFFVNCFLQIFLCTIYDVLFWSMIVLYFNQKIFRLFSSFSFILCVFVYGFINLILGKILKKEIDFEYSTFIREIFLHNVFYCPISFISFALGISYFHKMDLRI